MISLASTSTPHLEKDTSRRIPVSVDTIQEHAATALNNRNQFLREASGMVALIQAKAMFDISAAIMEVDE